MSQIGAMGTVYQQNTTLSEGIELLITNLGEIDEVPLEKQLIPLNIYQYLESFRRVVQQSHQQVSLLFRNVYFIYQNGMTALSSLVEIQERQIQQQTIATSDQNKLFVNLISFISMGVISLIGVLTFPLLGKIEDRKISVLKFFNLLSVEQIQ